VLGIWGQTATLIVSITLGSLALWPFVGLTIALLVYCALLVSLLLYHVTKLAALHKWLSSPSRDTLPDGLGLWELVFAQLARMLRLQKQSESHLSAALSRFQQVAAAVPEGMVILDASDRIEWCNPVAERHFGIGGKRDQGHHITNLVRQPKFAEYLKGQNYGEPLILATSRDNVEIVLSVHLIPYGDNQKLISSRDITRWERIETMRKDFIANVSHELRTPITVIAGFLETLADLPESDPDMTRRSIYLMREQATRMHRLVEDLLTLSKLEHAEKPSFEKHIAVATLLRSLYQDAIALSKEKHRIELQLSTEDDLYGNEEELRSAFSNLISNAIRYTPKNGVVRLIWERKGDNAVFSVQDSGIGIEQQHIPRLTERFYRVDRSRSRETGGTGLGLAIVKHVLNRHQARLEIVSTLGEGSTFSAVFPAQRLAQARAAATEKAS
jgi:two-component system, OmpR family, phosphate regulon sensor histidine kinase PhoR